MCIRDRSRTAQAVRLLQDCVENRGEVAGRRINDPQHFGGRGLLLQCLTRLGQEPRVFQRNDGLRREILQQRDFFLGECSNFASGNGEGAQGSVFPH